MKAVNLEKLLPADIPPGERVLWFGAPEPVSLWRRAYRADWVGAVVRRHDGVEFAVASRGRSPASSPRCARSASAPPRWRSSALLAWLSARTTLYVVTERRLILKTGIALPMFINMPFKQISAGQCARLRRRRGRCQPRSVRRSAHPLSGAVAERASAALRPARADVALRRRTRGRSPKRWRAAWRKRPARARRRRRARRPPMRRPAASQPRPREEARAMSEAAQHRQGVPRGVLIGAAALVCFALGATWVRAQRRRRRGPHAAPAGLSGARPRVSSTMPTAASASSTRANGAVLDRAAPGTNGFLRGALRGFAQERLRDGLGRSQPFTLTRWRDGTLSLQDKATDRRIDLDAFGPTQARSLRPSVRRQGGRPMSMLAQPPASNVPAPSRSRTRRNRCTRMSRLTAISSSSPATRCR